MGIMLIVLVGTASAADPVWTEDFNNLNLATLDGQNDWSNTIGDGWIVVDNRSYEGNKSVRNYPLTTTSTIEHNINATENGTISFWVRSKGGASSLQIRMHNSSNLLGLIHFEEDYDVSFVNDTTFDVFDTYNDDQWYQLTLHWNNNTGYVACINQTICRTGVNRLGNLGPPNRFDLDSPNLAVPNGESHVDYIEVYDVFNITDVAGSVVLHAPENQTYTSNRIDLNVTNSTPVEYWYYNLNNDTTNYTFTPNSTLLMALDQIGTHNITVYANDSSSGTWYSDNIWFSFAYITIQDEKIFKAMHRV